MSYHDKTEQGGGGILIWMLIIGSVTAGIGFFVKANDYITAGAIGVTAMGALAGYRSGAMKFVALVASLAAATYFAQPVEQLTEPYWREHLDQIGLKHRFISVGIAGFAVGLVAMIFTLIIGRILCFQRPWLQRLNSRVGFMLGGAQFGGLAFLLISGVLAIEPLVRERLEKSEATMPETSKKIATFVATAADATRTSAVGPLVMQWNPFEHVPSLKKVQESLKLVSNPNAMRDIAKHPALEELQKQPEFQQALEQLLKDPQVKKLADSGKGLDQQSLMSLMDNPALLKFCDDTNLLSEVSKVLPQLTATPQVTAVSSK